MSASSTWSWLRSRPLLLVFAVVHGVFTLYTAKGHFTDSHLYYAEAESVAERGELAIDNGFAETRSPALKLAGTVEHDGELYSQYPAVYSIVAAPFLRLFGEPGLFYLNSAALLAIVVLTVKLTGRLTRSDGATTVSLLVLLGGTYFWYYSQAIWPHMLQTLLIVGAAWMAVLGREDSRPWSARIAGAGALLGLATGVRLDSFFVLPALGALCVVDGARVRKVVSLLAGLAPLLLLLAVLNWVKFGAFLPFSYGTPIGAPERIVVSTRYAAAALPLLLLCVAFVVAEGGVDDHLGPGWRSRTVYSLAALTVASLVAIGEPLVRGVGVLLVDMRVLDGDVVETGMVRTASGAVVYAGHLKKALLQSAPFLPLVSLPLIKPRPLIGGRDRTLFRWLYLIPASYLIVFCTLHWHGGMAFDMRYLLPTLPFLAILAGMVVATLTGRAELGAVGRSWTFRGVVGLLVGLFAAAVLQGHARLPYREVLFLSLPLALAAATLLLIGPVWWRGGTLKRRGAALLCVPLFWGGPVAMADYAQQNAWRAVSESVAARFAPHIPDHSLVLGLQKDLLSKTDDVWFAPSREGTLEHMPALVAGALERGRGVFLLQGRTDRRLEAVGLRADSHRLELVEPYRVEEGEAGGGLFRVIPVGGNDGG